MHVIYSQRAFLDVLQNSPWKLMDNLHTASEWCYKMASVKNVTKITGICPEWGVIKLRENQSHVQELGYGHHITNPSAHLIETTIARHHEISIVHVISLRWRVDKSMLARGPAVLQYQLRLPLLLL
jgi:hypothetical protein